jgi:hypothetical protein
MPKASSHQSSTITKRLLIGDSGTGKTTALWSLVNAGKKLRVIDYDNLLASCINKMRISCPDKMDNLEFLTFQDKFRGTDQGPVVDGQPRAYIDGVKAMRTWDDGSDMAKLGPDYVVVVDTLTRMARSALWWAKGMQGASGLAEGVPMKGVRPEQFYHTAQQSLLNMIAYLTADSYCTNVLVIAHFKYMERDGMLKGFPVAVGNAICEEIPTYFPSVTMASKTGHGNDVKRILRTRSTQMIDLKDPKSFDEKFATELPMDDLYKLF